MTAKPPVISILMPGDEARVPCFLDKEAGLPTKNIGTEYVFDRIQYFRTPDDVRHPGLHEVQFLTPPAVQILRMVTLECFQRRPVGGRLFSAHHGHGMDDAITAISVDLLLAQSFCHNAKYCRSNQPGVKLSQWSLSPTCHGRSFAF